MNDAPIKPAGDSREKDWRDPNMSCLRQVKDQFGKSVFVEVDAEMMRRYHEKRIAYDWSSPEWRFDPTYNLKRSRR